MATNKINERVRKAYITFGQKVGALLSSPSRSQMQIMLFILGVGILATGLVSGTVAQSISFNFGDGLTTEYNDSRLADAVNAILTYVEGSFGALVMVAAGLAAILSSAFGQYRAALGALIVAVGAFILRSILGTFFNDDNIQA